MKILVEIQSDDEFESAAVFAEMLMDPGSPPGFLAEEWGVTVKVVEP